MKRGPRARFFEEPSSLLTNVHPFLVDLSVAPLVQQATASGEHAVRFAQNDPPIRREVEEPSDHNDIETSSWKRKPCPFGGERRHVLPASFRPQLGQHSRGRLNRHDMASAIRERNGHSARARPDVQNTRARLKAGADPQPAQPIV
jgi:hypothetical protein